MKMIIEVSGGNVVNIIATQPVSIHIIDHDNLKTGAEEVGELLIAQQPDGIYNEKEIYTAIKDHVNTYSNKNKL